MRIKGLLCFLMLSTLSCQLISSPYEWEQNRKRYVLTEKEEQFGEYVLKVHDEFEYLFEKDQLVMLQTIHRIIRVNNSEAIQRNNRIYISNSRLLELVDLKARAISKDGKVINFDKTNLKEIKDDDASAGQRIFAIEGAEIGSEIEYFYTRKMRASLFDRVYMQYNSPIKTSEFILVSPATLKFDFRSYNGYAKVSADEGKEKNIYKAEMNDIPELKREAFAQYNHNRKKIEYKLAYNTGRSQVRLNTWEDAGKTFYKILATQEKDDAKPLEKFVQGLGDNPSENLDKRIANIEYKIKTSIQISEQQTSQELSQIASIVKFKLASKQGIAKLFLAVFDKLKIDCQIVITCGRDIALFDGTFDTWAYLDEYALYFPATKGFLEPGEFNPRYPFITALMMEQDGLFIEPLTLGEVKSGLGSVKRIPSVDYTLSTDDLDISVEFASDMASNLISLKRKFSGYNALYIGPNYDLMTSEQRTKLIENILKNTAPDTKITNWKAGPLPGNAMSLLIDVNFTTDHFIETAGSRILFKVGELIGPQSELYQEDQRVTPVENDFNRGYDRIIRIKIPKGYEIKNPQDIRMTVDYDDAGKKPFLFQSDYKMNGEVLEITIKEYYKQIFAPLARYEDFRKVINAAADFNKITLVIEKK